MIEEKHQSSTKKKKNAYLRFQLKLFTFVGRTNNNINNNINKTVKQTQKRKSLH